MIKKSLLLISTLLSLGANAIETTPTQTYTISSQYRTFDNNENYIKEHNSKEEAEKEIYRFFKEYYNILEENINKEKDINSDISKVKYTPKNYYGLINLEGSENIVYREDIKLATYRGLKCDANFYIQFELTGQYTPYTKIKRYGKDYENTLDNEAYDDRFYHIRKDENDVLYISTYPHQSRVYPGEVVTFSNGVKMYKACHVTSLGLDWHLNSIELVNLESEKDILTQSCAMAGNPCDVGTGNKFQEEVEAITPFISFSRYYNSENTEYFDTTGYVGWTHTFSNRIYDQNLKNDLDEIVINDEKAKRNYYKKYSDTLYIGTTNANSTLKLVFEENELYEHVGYRTNVFHLDTGLLKRVIIEDNIYSVLYESRDNNDQEAAEKLITSVRSRFGSGASMSFVYTYYNSSEMYHLSRIYSPKGEIIYTKSNDNFFRNEEGDWEIQNGLELTKAEYKYNGIKQHEKRYHYEDPNYRTLLTGITDKNGIRYATWTYDENGWANSSEHAGGYERIDISADRSKVTNSKGAVTQYVFDKVAGKNILRNIISPDNVEIETGDFNRENPYAKTDIENNNNTTTKNEYNDLNQLTRTYTVDSQNNILSDVEYEYIERTELGGGFKVSKIKTPTLQVEYQYETFEDREGYSRNRPYAEMNYGIPTRDLYEQKPVKITYTDMTNHTVPYQTNGRKKEINFLYHSLGQHIKAIDGFRTDIEDIIYYETSSSNTIRYIFSAECVNNYAFKEGRVDHDWDYETIPNCRYVKYEDYYRNTNLPQRIIDENGVVTKISYGDRMRLESSTIETSNGNITTSYVYDEEDQVKQVNLPNGSWLKYTYNGARYLEKIENSLGESIEFDTDTEGMVTERRVKSATGTIVQQQNWVYSNSNRLLKTISGNLFEEFYGYDSIGNIANITDHLNNFNQLNYDGLNRISKEIDALNGEVSKTYDTANRINTVTDQKGNQTKYTIDGFDNVIRIDSPDTGITDMWYDEANNMTKKLLADGTEINYVYDASNRLIDIIYPDSTLNVHFDYDTATYGKGKIALITYKHGSIAYTYNELGLVDNQTNIVNNKVYVTSYQYTNWGALNGITYPSGRQIDYTLDSLDRITGINVDNQALISNVEYLPFGSFKSFDYGNGISFSGTFDKDYLVRNVTHTNAGNDIFNETYDYEKMYQINTITDNLDSNKNQSFTYDAKSQLINAIGNYGDYEYTLDPVGNRLSKTVNMIENETYNVDTLSNKLLSVDKGAETRTLNYDDNGNIIEDIGYDLMSKILTYGDNNRLINVDGYIYGYNPMNQRVIDNGKVNNYDLNGQLISVNDGNLTIEYIYLGNMKIAMLQDDGIDLNTYYAHNNYMGMPRLFTDESKNIVWSGDFTPFGELYNENGSVSNVIRFTGQYKNLESGYFYNYHRDYDASLGRYLQSDPIGLNGGINTYAYVAGNPINYLDPLGLKCSCANPDKLLDLLIGEDGNPRKDGTDWSYQGDSGFILGGKDKFKCNRYVDYYIERAGGDYPNIGGSMLSRLLRKNPASPNNFYTGVVNGWEYNVGILKNSETLSKLKVGDLLVTKSHIGIYIGDGRSISANNNYGARFGTDIKKDYKDGFAFRCTCDM